MDRSAEVGRAAFVDPEALVLFLDALRRAGYRISTDQYIAAQDLVLALASQPGGAGDAERLARMLGPLVCATAKEQAEFGPLFDRWIDRLLPSRRRRGDDALGGSAAAPTDGRGRGLADELDAIQRSRRWLRWVASPVAVVLVVVAAYFAFRRTDGTLLVHSTPDRAVVRSVSRDSAAAAPDSTRRDASDSLGVTPLRIDRRPGTYAFRLTLPGFRDTTVTVEVTPRTTRDVDVRLDSLGTDALLSRALPGGARAPDTPGIGTIPIAPANDASGSRRTELLPSRRTRQRIAFSDSGDTMAVGGAESGVRTWDVATGSLLDVGPPLALWARLVGDAVAYSPDSARVTTPGGRSVVLRDPADAAFADTLEEQSGHVSRVVFSSDGRFLASGDASGGIRVWATEPRPTHTLDLYAPRWTSRLAMLRGRREAPVIPRLRVSTGGNLMATTSASTGILLWDIESGVLLDTLVAPHEEILADPVIISTDGRRVMRLPASSNRLEGDVGTSYWVDVWDVDSARVRGPRRLRHEAEVLLAAMASDGRQVATVDGEGVFRLWDIAGSGEPFAGRILPQDTTSARSWFQTRVLQFSPDGRRLLAVRPDGAVFVWRTDSAAGPPAVLAVNSMGVTAAFTADGDRVVTGDGAAVRIWTIDRPGESTVLDTGVVSASVGVGPEGSRAVTVSRNGSVRLWDLDRPDRSPRVLLPNGNARPVWDLAADARLSPDGQRVLVTFPASSQVELLPASGARRTARLQHPAAADYAAMSSNGEHVVTASQGTVRIWNADGITELADLTGHTGEVTGLSFSPDGRRLASAGADGRIILWDTRTFAPLDSLTPLDSLATRDSAAAVDSLPARGAPAAPGSIASRDSVPETEELDDVAFSPDGRSLAAAGSTGMVRIYDTPGSRRRTVRNLLLPAWPIGVAILLVPLPWLLYRWLLRRRATAFVRRQADEQPLIERMTLRSIDDGIFPESSVLRVASRLRRRVEVPSPELDVAASVAQTLRHGGIFTPAFHRLKVRPEYLALVDRATLGDQQCAFVDELLERLRDDQVLITRYYFDGDPRVCFSADPHGLPVSLGTLTQHYDSHRVLLFADARCCFNPVTGEMAGWTDLLRRWPNRALLTPELPARWGSSEVVVAREFPVHHASVAGLAELVDGARPGGPDGASTQTSGGRYPSVLQRRPGRWIERDAPPGAEVDEMLAQVRAYLDEPGMIWLAACAVYPAMSWKLTLNLGHELRTDDGAMLLDADRLLRLARLPWFRQGYMPDWLRLRLLDLLAPAQEMQVRRTLERLLLTAVAGDDPAFDLEVASRHEGTIHALAGPILRRLRRKSPPSDPLRDYVFAEFMSGRSRERLAVRVARVVPALRARRAARGGNGSALPHRWSRVGRALPYVLISLFVGSKVAPPAAHAVEEWWREIPESPLPVRNSPRVLRPGSPASLARVPSDSGQVLGPTPNMGATPFRDMCDDVAEVRVRAGWWMNAVQLSCRTTSGGAVLMPRRGGEGGGEQVFQLQPGERLVAVSGSHDGEYGEFLFSLQLHTDRRSSPVYGNEGPSKGQTSFRFAIPAGRRFAGLVGRAGAARSSDGTVDDYLVSIGLVHVRDTTQPSPSANAALPEAGRAFCAAANQVIPFNRPGRDASMAQVTSLLRPDSGALWTFQRDHLGGLLVKRDGRWVATDDGSVSLTPEFVAFFDRAARLSDFLFQGRSRPRVDFVLRATVPSQAAEVLLIIDQDSARFTQTAQTGPSRALSWPNQSSTAPVSVARLVTIGRDGAERVVADASGDWALFGLIASADRATAGTGNSVRTEWQGGSDAPQDRITIDFTFRSPIPLLPSGQAPQCPARITR